MQWQSFDSVKSGKLNKGRRRFSEYAMRSPYGGTGCFSKSWPNGLPEPNRRDSRKECCVLFFDTNGHAEARKSEATHRWHTNTMASFYCEYCGQKFSSVQTLTGASCSRHPNGCGKGKHKLYEGEEASKYICEYCGQTFSSIQTMTGLSCSRHPDGCGKGRHHPFIGGIKQRYICKYCGQSFSSLQTMTGSSCSRHPEGCGKGKHSPSI